jgi:site-specific DNA-methyltransferase (adenine-specific)
MPISEVYNEDYMVGMARYPDKYFDLAIVDPPYENNDAIGIKNGNKHSGKRTDYHQFDNIAPPQEYFDELKRVSKHQIVWGGNYFGIKGGAIVWNKYGTAFGEAEIAICSTHHSVRIFAYTWNGMIQENMKYKEKRIHPTQKPVSLYKWLLSNYANPTCKILDTHLGSQSSRIACWDGGFNFYGWELDPVYFSDGNKRFENFKLQGCLEFQ